MSKYRVIKDLEEHFLFKSKLASVNDEDVVNLKYFPKTEFFRKRIATEFSLAGRIDHDNLLIPKDSGEDEIGPYVAPQ